MSILYSFTGLKCLFRKRGRCLCLFCAHSLDISWKFKVCNWLGPFLSTPQEEKPRSLSLSNNRPGLDSPDSSPDCPDWRGVEQAGKAAEDEAKGAEDEAKIRLSEWGDQYLAGVRNEVTRSYPASVVLPKKLYVWLYLSTNSHALDVAIKLNQVLSYFMIRRHTLIHTHLTRAVVFYSLFFSAINGKLTTRTNFTYFSKRWFAIMPSSTLTTEL